MRSASDPTSSQANQHALLDTKTFIPPNRSGNVTRPRLIERLNEGLSHKLSLVSAPAGFGKTTLISEWIANCDRPAAWLSLGVGDSDLARFLAYLITALQSIGENIGVGALGMLQSGQNAPTEIVLTDLLNDITGIQDSFILVLDDYHVVDAQSIDSALGFLIDHLPPQMHLVIATREDPNLPLAKLRARAQLTEIRASDLRFSDAETANFLNQKMKLNLSEENIAALEARTEGWITGLQLAAISLQRCEDIPSFIDSFTGSNRFVLDYLVEEVLQQLPEQVLTFLLHTSVLDCFCASLCDAVLSESSLSGHELLNYLEQANLLVIPLDDKRQWYRYHHLFADVLRVRLRHEHGDQEATLHLRASEWYDQHGLQAEAVQHAILAKDYDQAANLAELAWPDWSGGYKPIEWLGWLKELPDDLVKMRPVLSLSYAWALLNGGNPEAAELRLQDAEKWMSSKSDTSGISETSSSQMVVADEEQFKALPVSITTARAYHAQAVGDISGTVQYTEKLLDLLSTDDHDGRGTALALLGLAYWASGDLEAAHRSFSEGLASMQKAGLMNSFITGIFVLADLKVTLGHLHEAEMVCKKALQLARKLGKPVPLGTEDVYSGMSEIHREWGLLETAIQDLQTCRQLGEQVELPDWQYRWCVAQARLEITFGNLDEALDLFDEAESVYVRTPLPEIRPIPTRKARVWILQGRLAEALVWAHERGISTADKLTFLKEYEHITLARALIAKYYRDQGQNSINELIAFMERLQQAAEAGGRTTSIIEIIILQALACDTQADYSAALTYLAKALSLAEAEGYVRIFADEGPQMANLLSLANTQGIFPEYTSKLLAAFEAGQQKKAGQWKQANNDPLSRREIEVLRLISLGLTNNEISDRLFIALSTVKGHNQRIFEKLQVKRRTEAVAKAREVGYL